MAEEFQESEVIFPDDSRSDNKRKRPVAAAISTMMINPKTNSEPVKIPPQTAAAYSLPSHYNYMSLYDDYEGDDDFDKVRNGTSAAAAAAVVPPHLIVARRVAAKTACSFYEHHGKALKGRNLSLVRNSILRMTGFLEA